MCSSFLSSLLSSLCVLVCAAGFWELSYPKGSSNSIVYSIYFGGPNTDQVPTMLVLDPLGHGVIMDDRCGSESCPRAVAYRKITRAAILNPSP